MFMHLKVSVLYVFNCSLRIFLVLKAPDSYDVVFLDFGNWDTVPTVDIHLLLPEFATLSAQAVPCSLTKVNRIIS